MSGVEKTAAGPRIGDQVTDAPVVIARSEGDEAIPIGASAATRATGATADTYFGPKEVEPVHARVLPDGNLNAKIRAVLPEAFPSRVRKAIYDELAGLSSEDLTKQFYSVLLRHALDHWLAAGELHATFPEDIHHALDAKLTLAARGHNSNLILEVLVPWLAGWQMEAITRFLADPKQLVGLLTWQIPLAVKANFEFGPPLLHSTIQGGEFDSANITAAMERQAKLRMNNLLVRQKLYKAALYGIPMSRDFMLPYIKFTDGSRGPTLPDDDFKIRLALAETNFARMPDLWVYLRDELFPLFTGKNDIVAASFGPGFSVMEIDETLPIFVTYEPFLLAAHLPAGSKVHVYDWAPEVSLAMREFKGRMAVLTIWDLAEKADLSSAEEMFVIGNLRWRDLLQNTKFFFERFIEEKGIRIIRTIPNKNFVGIDETIYVLEWPQPLYEGVVPSPRPRNFIYDAYEPQGLDLAFFQLGGKDYLDGSLGVATLIRIVHQLSPGGYLITDPYVMVLGEYQGTRFLSYSPDPGMMRALGLEAVFDLRKQEGGGGSYRGIVFRKVGPSNAFVLRMIERIEGAYARARKFLSQPEAIPIVRATSSCENLGQDAFATAAEIAISIAYVAEHPPFTVASHSVSIPGPAKTYSVKLDDAIFMHSRRQVTTIEVDHSDIAFREIVIRYQPQKLPAAAMLVLRSQGQIIGYRTFDVYDGAEGGCVHLDFNYVYVDPASRGYGFRDTMDQTIIAALLYAYRNSSSELVITYKQVENPNNVRRYVAAGMEAVPFDVHEGDEVPAPFSLYDPALAIVAGAVRETASYRTTISIRGFKAHLENMAADIPRPLGSRDGERMGVQGGGPQFIAPNGSGGVNREGHGGNNEPQAHSAAVFGGGNIVDPGSSIVDGGFELVVEGNTVMRVEVLANSRPQLELIEGGQVVGDDVVGAQFIATVGGELGVQATHFGPAAIVRPAAAVLRLVR